MKNSITKFYILILTLLVTVSFHAQEFQGKAYYFSKTTIDMSRFNRGGEPSEQQKKERAARMKSLLEKTYVLTFNKEESIFIEDEKLASPVSGGGGRRGSFGSNFSPGPEYKNIKERLYLQDQEFFGKQFLIKEDLAPLEWVMGSETKQIGQYLCFKATAKKVSTAVEFGPPRRGDSEEKPDSSKEKEEETPVEMVEVTAWYTMQIPVSQGPGEYWGLPGLILEVIAGNNIMLCNKIVMNPAEKTEIKAPKKGAKVTKQEYKDIVTKKMEEFSASRGRGGNGRPGGGRGR